MRSIRTALALILGAVALIALTGAQAVASPAHPCRGFSFTASPRHPGQHRIACAGNITLHAAVDGRQLLIGDVSDRGQVATLYGRGTVIRIVQRHGHVRVLAVTTWPRAHVHVWFTAYH